MAYTYKNSSEYNYRSNYKYRARVGIEVATNSPTVYKVNWIIEVQALNGYLYGMAVTGSGECSGTKVGYTTSAPYSWTTVARVSGDKTYTKTTSKQTKTFYAKAYGKTTPEGYGSAGGSGVTATYTITVPALASYTVTYKPNGGTGGPTTQTKYYKKPLKLLTSTPTKEGYDFISWNTTATGTGTTYLSGGSYSNDAAVTLYAQWSEKTFTITYDANGGSLVQDAPASETKYYSQDKTLTNKEPVRNNYRFLGWGTSSSATTVEYSPGGTYSNQQSVTLYAIWAYNAYNVAYNTTANGGSGEITTQTANIGTSLTLNNGTGVTPPSQFFLESWNTVANGIGERYELGQTYTSSIASEIPLMLYAQYKEVYVVPSVQLSGSRIDSYNENSAGGEKVRLSYTWSAARDANQYFGGRFILQYTNGSTDDSGNVIWNNFTESTYNFSFDGTTVKNGSGSFTFDESTTETYLNNKYSFRISVSDITNNKTSYSTTYTILPIATKGVEKEVTIVPSSFVVSRVTEYGTSIRVNFQWTPYYNGNDYYTSEVIFPLRIDSIRADSGEIKHTETISININNWIYDSSTKTGTTTIIINSDNYSSESKWLGAEYTLKFYIDSVSSILIKGDQDPIQKDTIFQNSQERGVILAGGFPVHINADGTGIALFGSATDVNGFKVGKPTLLNNSLEVTGLTNLKNELSVTGNTNLIGNLTVNGISNLNNGLIVNNSTNLNGNLTTNGSTNLNGILTVNSPSNLNDEVNVTGRIIATGDIIANDGKIGYNLDRLLINECYMTSTLSLGYGTSGAKTLPLVHRSGSNGWLKHSGNGVKVNGPCYVMVWGYFLATANDGDVIYMGIARNGARAYMTMHRMAGASDTINLLPAWLSCDEGDILTIQAWNGNAARGTIDSGGSNYFVRVQFQVVGVR